MIYCQLQTIEIRNRVPKERTRLDAHLESAEAHVRADTAGDCMVEENAFPACFEGEERWRVVEQQTMETTQNIVLSCLRRGFT